MICDISLSDPIEIHSWSAIESIFFWNITDNVFYFKEIIHWNMGEVHYIILIVLIMSTLVGLSELRFGKFVSFEVGLSELSVWSSRVYKFTERSSNRKCSIKKVVLRNITKFTGKYLCQRLVFSKKAGGLQPYLKRDSGTGFLLWVLRHF